MDAKRRTRLTENRVPLLCVVILGLITTLGVLSLPNAHALGRTPADRVVEKPTDDSGWSALGAGVNGQVRAIAISGNTTDWADAAKEETLHGTRHGGLTGFGEEVVQTMNRLGMIVDLSHAAESTFWHVLRVSKAPVMASHSDAYALTPHFRNLKDEQIRALAERGGLVGINFYCVFLDAEFMRRQMQAEEQHKAELDDVAARHPYDFPTQADLERRILSRAMGPVPVSASRIVDHVMHVVQLVGPDHVALGSDFDGFVVPPEDVRTCGLYPL